jgi:hypothetical protein
MFLLFPNALKLLTWAVLKWEGYGPFLLFVPVKTHLFRSLAAVGIIAMHLGFQMSMRLGIFGWICAAGALGLLPSWFWDAVLLPYLRTPTRTSFKIFYHSHCKCYKLLECVKMFFLVPQTQLLPFQHLQHDEEEQVPHEHQHVHSIASKSWLVVECEGRVCSNGAAVAAVCRVSPLLWPFSHAVTYIASFLPDMQWHTHQTCQPLKPFRKHKKRRNTSMVYLFVKIGLQLSSSIVAVLCMLLCFSWVLGNFGWAQYTTPESCKWMVWLLHLDQSWGMFSPRPPVTHWYYIIDARLDNGSQIELFKVSTHCLSLFICTVINSLFICTVINSLFIVLLSILSSSYCYRISLHLVFIHFTFL